MSRKRPNQKVKTSQAIRGRRNAKLFIGILLLAGAAAWAIHNRQNSGKPSSTSGAPRSKNFAPTVANAKPAPSPAPEGMVWIPGGEFSMGSDESSESMCGLPGLTRDCLPIHRVYVDGFFMDITEVSNEEFEKFVKATSYITVAE